MRDPDNGCHNHDQTPRLQRTPDQLPYVKTQDLSEELNTSSYVSLMEHNIMYLYPDCDIQKHGCQLVGIRISPKESLDYSHDAKWETETGLTNQFV